MVLMFCYMYFSKGRDSSDSSLTKQNSKEEEAFQQGYVIS